MLQAPMAALLGVCPKCSTVFSLPQKSQGNLRTPTLAQAVMAEAEQVLSGANPFYVLLRKMGRGKLPATSRPTSCDKRFEAGDIWCNSAPLISLKEQLPRPTAEQFVSANGGNKGDVIRSTSSPSTERRPLPPPATPTRVDC